MVDEEYRPPKKGLVGTLATWTAPLCVLYVVGGLLFADRVVLGGPSALSFQWTVDGARSDAINFSFLVLLLVALIVALFVVRRRRRREDAASREL